MRAFLLVSGAVCSLLAACSDGPPQMPSNLNDAAQFCIAAKMLSIRNADGRQRGDRMTISAAAQTHAYPMIAASKLEDFDWFLDDGDLVSSDQVVDFGKRFDPSDFGQLVSDCDAHFGITGTESLPTLPTDNLEAIYSCYAASHWTMTLAAQSLYDDEGRGPHFRRLFERMSTRKDLFVAQRGGIGDAEGEALTVEGLRHAFSQGNIMNYVAACDARFRA